MKVIHPLTYQLSIAEDRIKSLEKENHELQLEVARLTAQDIQRSTTRPSALPKGRQSSTSDSMIPNYARSTTVSRLRSLPSSASSPESTLPSTGPSPTPLTRPTPVMVNGKKCYYKDGKLSVMKYGYLKPIRRCRRSKCWGCCWPTVGLRRPLKTNAETSTKEPSSDDSADSTYDADCSDGTGEVEKPQPARTLRIMSQTEWDDLVDQKAIAIQTRLADCSWPRGAAYKIYIDHDALFDILSEAEAVAKRCLWEWMRTHRPQECRRWLGYRSDVDFGRERLTNWLRWVPSTFFDFRRTRSREVEGKLNSLVYLRNFVHHFRGERSQVCEMDRYVEDVQKLAVLFYDREGAGRARALRDRLRGEAERALVEVETLMMLTALPEAGNPWKPHHASLVQGAASLFCRYSPANYYPPDDHGESYPPIVWSAAREWATHQTWLDCRVSLPEVEARTEREGRGSRGPGPVGTSGGERDTPTARGAESVCTRRRHSFSADMVRRVHDVGEKSRVGTRRRGASLCGGL